MNRKQRRAAAKARQRHARKVQGPISADSKLRTAVSHHQAGRLAEAKRIYAEILCEEPKHAGTLNLLGVVKFQEGDLGAASELIGKAIAVKPDYAEAHNNLSIVLKDQGKLEEAVATCRKALELKPDYADAHNNLGNALRGLGKLVDAVATWRKVLELKPDYAEVHNNLGIVLKEQGRLEEAIASYQKAIALKPDYAEAHNNLGVVLKDQGKLKEAMAAYRKALELKPDYAEADYNLGIALKEQGKLADAEAVFRKALELKPDYAKAHINLGVVLKDQGKLADAEDAFRKAMELKPGYGEAHNNLGVVLKDQGQLKHAEAAWRKAVELKPDFAEAYYNLGALLNDQGRLADAAAACRRATTLAPDDATAQALLVHMLWHTCDWKNLEPAARRLDDLVESALREDVKCGETPFISVTRCDDASHNFEIAKSWSADMARRMSGLTERLPSGFKHPRKGKIRVGYLSGDFQSHATAHLMVSLFGLHKRDEFEIHAYSYGPDDSSEYRRRIANDCDRFVDLRDFSTIGAARRIHEDAVDILVDLKGYTKATRLEICALRPAPVQATYLGFPGSTGAGFFDYILTDRTVTPEDQAPYYTENFVYLPHCYQVNDHAQAISDKSFTRAEFGLPEEGFVFCSFNQAYKIEAVMWDVWMRMLKAVPGSVLWLYRSNEAVERNLKREAGARNVDPERIVFADKLAKPEHLARLKIADLFLDTRIVNGHTTASDSLWAGVPLITLQGRHFASRVASSLLAAVGLPELVAHGLDSYEALAVRLALNPGELAVIRERLAANRLSAPLFDTPRFARDLERAYKEMWELYLAGEKPRQIEVFDSGL